jgi:probable rRNA maturation factor
VPAAAALKRAELSILLTGDPQIRRLNREWRGKDKATDVLSFPQYDATQLRSLARRKSSDTWELGDIVISLPRAYAQAKGRGFRPRQELDWLLVHGLLHLLGYDHEVSAAEEAKMRALELGLLEEIGWGKTSLERLAASLRGT